MKKYKVKLMFQYSDILHVEANDEYEAVKIALDSDFKEEFEAFIDSEVSEDDE